MAEEKKHFHKEEQNDFELVRILGKDLHGDKKISVGLTKIKGMSWAFSSAMCKILKINPDKKIQELTEEEIKKIESTVKEVNVPNFLKNRQKDFNKGEDLHLYGSDLNLQQEFDIKRLRKIKSYKGIRHANKLPVRGQKTKSNFRPNKKKSGKVGNKKK